MVNSEVGAQDITVNKKKDPGNTVDSDREENIRFSSSFFSPVYMNRTNAGDISFYFQAIR